MEVSDPARAGGERQRPHANDGYVRRLARGSRIVRAQSTLLGGISTFGFSVFSPPTENTLFSLNFG